jgi:hypothetical protein
MLLMIGASCAFSTPIGYQTNLMVFKAGQYNWGTYIKFGTPLAGALGLFAIALTPEVMEGGCSNEVTHQDTVLIVLYCIAFFVLAPLADVFGCCVGLLKRLRGVKRDDEERHGEVEELPDEDVEDMLDQLVEEHDAAHDAANDGVNDGVKNDVAVEMWQKTSPRGSRGGDEEPDAETSQPEEEEDEEPDTEMSKPEEPDEGAGGNVTRRPSKRTSLKLDATTRSPSNSAKV